MLGIGYLPTADEVLLESLPEYGVEPVADEKRASYLPVIKRFLDTWAGVGDLFDEVGDDEKQQILQHYVEGIEFRETDPSGKDGVYALQLFPEVRQYFRPDDGDGEGGAPTRPVVGGPETPNGAALPAEGNPVQLTADDAVVCTGVRLAPRRRHLS